MAQMVKNPPECRRPRFDPWVGKVPRRREWLLTPVFLPRELHGQRNLMGYSPWGLKELDMTEWLTFWFTSLYLPVVIFVFCSETNFFHDTTALWESLNFPYLCFFCYLLRMCVCLCLSVWERSNDSSVFTAYILKKKYFLRRYFLVRLNIYKLNYRIKGFLKCTFLYNHKLLFILMKDGKISYFLFSI